MAPHPRPHVYVPGGTAVTGTSVDDLIRPGLRHAFPLPAEDGPNEDRFRRLLEALAQARSDPQPQAI
jgi:hypothetical protein